MESLLLCLWKLFEYSPNKSGVFVEVQGVYGTNPLKLIGRQQQGIFIQMMIFIDENNY